VRALVLTGDAGVGKTTIWEAGGGWPVRAGCVCSKPGLRRPEAALPFAALGDLLGPVVDEIELPKEAAWGA